MTYQKGSKILAADYNNFFTTSNNIYGVGYNDRGYGQTISQGTVSAGNVIHSSQWINLINIINVCANQQGTNVSSLPSTGLFAVGQKIIAEEQASPSSRSYEIANNVNLIDTNRMNFNSPSMSISTNVWNVSRSSNWSNAIGSQVSLTWANEDSARHFFNSAGQIRIHGSQPNIYSPEDSAWNTSLVSGLGTLFFTAHNTTNSGTFNGSVVMGYYELTDSFQTIFTGNSGSGGYDYSTNSITITAKRLGYTGINGGNGNGIQFGFILSDTGSYSSAVVSAGTEFYFDTVKATTYLSGISSPSYSTPLNF